MEKKRLYLDGKWVDFPSHFSVRDPGKNEVIAEVAAADAAAARKAVESARRAFPGWRALTGMERADHIHAVIGKIAERRDEIAQTITKENGKPLAQSLGEVGMTIDHFRWFAEEARRAYGRVIPHQAPGKRHLVLRQPIGVVAAIAPWNFPLVLAVRKVAPALAAGCTVILRPASQTPLSALLLAECFEAAKAPLGVFQVIAGPAGPIAGEFLANPDCRKISFTGSTEVGRKLLEGSAATITKLSLELGGHAPVIVFEDADIDQAVEGALVTKFRNTGQSCIAANRIYVQSAIYESFLEKFTARAKEMKVGYGLEPGVDIGPLVNEAGLKTALRHVENAVGSGARLLCGGKALDRKDGFYFEPTVLADVPATAACMREETFAPIAPVCRFETVAEAIRQANDTPYGLAAYAYTRDLGLAWHLAESLEAGTIGINDSVPSTSNAPFGGVKESGQGRELGIEGLDAFLETKHISFGGISKPFGA